MLRVAEEEEYRSATREDRRAIGMPWPVRQMAVISPSAGADEETGELPALPQRFEKLPQSAGLSGPLPSPQEGAERPWWRRMFGSY